MSNPIKGVLVYFDNTTITGVALPPPPFPGFAWDAVTTVNESYPAQASDHPIQAGGDDVTDNVHTGPPMLSVSGVVSTMPIFRPSKMLGTNVDGSAFSSDLAVAMRQLLLGYQKARRRVVVASSRGTWSPCIILNVDVSWGPAEGTSLMISAQFKQIKVAKQQLVPAVQDADLLASGVNAGGTSSGSSTSIGTWGAEQ